MSRPIIKEVNSSTNEEIEREMTAEEHENYLSLEAHEQLKNQEKIEKEAARQSALEKLAALGLTEAEIAALAG